MVKKMRWFVKILFCASCLLFIATSTYLLVLHRDPTWPAHILPIGAYSATYGGGTGKNRTALNLWQNQHHNPSPEGPPVLLAEATAEATATATAEKGSKEIIRNGNEPTEVVLSIQNQPKEDGSRTEESRNNAPGGSVDVPKEILSLPNQTQQDENPPRTEETQQDDNAIPAEKTQRDRKPPQNKEKQRFWRYDDAGPDILHARTHFLSSIPSKYRILSDEVLTGEQDDKAFIDDLRDRYATNPDHTWPRKLHLYETNPSIAVLPERYRNHPSWLSFFGSSGKDNNHNDNSEPRGAGFPRYVASYRVTHWNNCHDGETNLKLYGGSWDVPKSEIGKTDYLGIALLDADMNILVDTTVTLKSVATTVRDKKNLFSSYSDYRLFNLGDGGGNDDGGGNSDDHHDELYLTSEKFISPIALQLLPAASSSSSLSFPAGDDSQIPDNFVEITTAFPMDSATTDRGPVLKVWTRDYSACPMGAYEHTVSKQKKGNPTNKNLLYFGKRGDNTAKALFYPRHNPNDVRDVHLNRNCKKRDNKRIIRETTIDYNTPAPKDQQPVPSFQTIEALKYPNKADKLFMSDRGSACCVKVKKDLVRQTIASAPVTNSTSTSKADTGTPGNANNSDEHDTLLVAIVHPKTKFPGKRLPRGVNPNTYLSRFIAFLPEAPHTIVAQSGMFCLGFPSRGIDDEEQQQQPSHTTGRDNNSGGDGYYESPLTYRTLSDTMNFANETLRCPRIHFILSMIDKVKEDPSEEDAVLLSYGVSDCFSRVVEIKKSEIVRMLSP